ncbi:MAG: hypothetical protein M1823_002550 [Watsoniomyces obsoletus]|nr:MAG: hypothetical protein M1823_002550 [Watsoniomyces obsoletus]
MTIPQAQVIKDNRAEDNKEGVTANDEGGEPVEIIDDPPQVLKDLLRVAVEPNAAQNVIVVSVNDDGMDPGVIHRIEQWLEETHPRDPDRTDTYLDVDSEGNPSIHSSDQELPDNQRQQESGEPGQRSTQERNVPSRPVTPVFPSVDPELLRMMHPVQRAMAAQREAAAKQRADGREQMNEAARAAMDRPAIALAKSRGYVIDRMTGRPKQPDPPIKILKRSPIRFTRGTEAPIKSTRYIGTVRHEQGESSGQQRRTRKPPPTSTGKDSDRGSTKEPLRDPRKRRRTTPSDFDLRSNREIERQLNVTTEQARQYQELQARPGAQQTQQGATTIQPTLQQTKTRSGKGKEREKKKDVTKKPNPSHKTDTIDLTKEPESDYIASQVDLDVQLALEKSAWTEAEDIDLRLAIEQSLLETGQSTPKQPTSRTRG